MRSVDPLCLCSARLRRAYPAPLALLLGLLLAPHAPGQDEAPLRIGGVVPGGIRRSVTEKWGILEFELANYADHDRQVRVVVFYPGQDHVQYGRDLWVPARTSLNSWLLAGPAPAQDRAESRDLEFLLYDRTGGKDVLILPSTEERKRDRRVMYRKAEPSTAILVDDEPAEALEPGTPPQPPSRVQEAITFARTFRDVRNLSDRVHSIGTSLPATPHGFDGLDHFFLASNRIADDPTGMRALRQWVLQGGIVWVMLDLVDPQTLTPLLGDALDFQVVDRVGLTDFEVRSERIEQRTPVEPLKQSHERPVDLVRVLLPPGDRVLHTIDGWPAWFMRRLGRGKVVVTTLGPRGWHRPRTRRDGPSRYEQFPLQPVGLEPLNVLGDELLVAPKPFAVEEHFRAPLEQEIGYAVVRRGTVGLVFAAFLLAALGLGLALRRSRRPERLGWLAPAAGLTAAAVLVGLGEQSRRAVPATVALAQVVHTAPDTREAALAGLLAVYRPTAGTAPVGVTRGGHFDLDMRGTEGQVRRLLMTDLGAWHWDNLSLPAGVRFGTFQNTAPTGEPVTAVATFGPNGLEGKYSGGPFGELSDAVIRTPATRALAVGVHADGSFRAGSGDVLPPGQFLAGTLLTDQQQRRQEVYRAFLERASVGRERETRNLLLGWARPIDLGFQLAPEPRTAGTALLVMPLRLERPAPGTRVTVPGPFLPYRRIREGLSVGLTHEGNSATDMDLRFQLPAEVLPLKIERARVLARFESPSRRVTVSGMDGTRPVEVHRVDSPLDPIRIDLTDQRLLGLDSEGGLFLKVDVGAPLEGGRDDVKWYLHYIEVEVTGQTSPGR